MGQARGGYGLPVYAKDFEGIELARGYFEGIAVVESGYRVNGWMLLPDRELESISVYWNGDLVGSADVELRQDVASVFPWIPHAGRSGFVLRLPNAIADGARIGRIDLLGCQGGRGIALMNTLFRPDLDTVVPTPPAELTDRIGACGNDAYFKLGGLKLFGDVMEPMLRHLGHGSVRRLLDWGCGCGRVTAHFLLDPNVLDVFGCDIDPEAIVWCRDHLKGGNFLRIDPWPPTPYEEATFDVAVGISVFTHLPGPVQRAWLAEMRRLVAPRGLFLASTHGEYAASFVFPRAPADPEPPPRLVEKVKSMLAARPRGAGLLRDGIVSDVINPSLDRIAPDGYYRDVYQTREYTVREWSRYFEILEYIERGVMNHQDLVVMRRPA